MTSALNAASAAAVTNARREPRRLGVVDSPNSDDPRPASPLKEIEARPFLARSIVHGWDKVNGHERWELRPSRTYKSDGDPRVVVVSPDDAYLWLQLTRSDPRIARMYRIDQGGEPRNLFPAVQICSVRKGLGGFYYAQSDDFHVMPWNDEEAVHAPIQARFDTLYEAGADLGMSQRKGIIRRDQQKGDRDGLPWYVWAAASLHAVRDYDHEHDNDYICQEEIVRNEISEELDDNLERKSVPETDVHDWPNDKDENKKFWKALNERGFYKHRLTRDWTDEAKRAFVHVTFGVESLKDVKVVRPAVEQRIFTELERYADDPEFQKLVDAKMLGEVIGTPPTPPASASNAPIGAERPATPPDATAGKSEPQSAPVSTVTAEPERALTIMQPPANSIASLPMVAQWDLMRQQATVLIKSGFLPQSIKTPEQAITIMMMGQALGIEPIVALNTINVIQGKPTVSPQLMLALVRKSGQLESFRCTDDGTTCTVVMKRRGEPEHVETFSMSDASSMQLAGKDNWKKQPATMRKWRAVAAACRVVFPDVTWGIASYTAEEINPDVTVDYAA